jgi:hypothetical protein
VYRSDIDRFAFASLTSLILSDSSQADILVTSRFSSFSQLGGELMPAHAIKLVKFLEVEHAESWKVSSPYRYVDMRSIKTSRRVLSKVVFSI